MSMSRDEFVQQLTACQSRLYTYIFMLLADATAANDVLQETNIVLWQKAAEFTPGTNFAAWAATVARFEVLCYRKSQRARRHIFDQSLIEQIAVEAAQRTEDVDARRIALRQCLKKLPRRERELVHRRYNGSESVQNIARCEGRSSGAVALSLFRIRNALANCIERALGREDSR